MKSHDRTGLARPDSLFLVPLLVLFVTAMSGPTLPEAFHRAWSMFTRGWTALALWSQVIALDLLLVFYCVPVFKAYLWCKRECRDDSRLIRAAIRHLNRIRSFSILASMAVFTAGRVLVYAIDPAQAGQAAAGVAPGNLFQVIVIAVPGVLEACVAGFFVGVILSLQVEDRLYPAKQAILACSPASGLSYSSLYSKTLLMMLAILLYTTMQGLSLVTDSFSVLRAMQAGRLFLADPLGATPDLFNQARRSTEIAELLKVFLVKIAALGFFISQMLFQLKRLIRKPLATIHDRLSALNSPNPQAGRVIDLVQNDEFSGVYRQINELIQKQRGQLEASRRRFEDVVAGAADPIIAFDRSLAIRLFNPAAEACFGLPRERAIGQPLSLFLGDEAGRLADGHVHEDNEELGRHPWRAADGSTRLMEAHLSRSGEGAEEWTTAILRDVTRRAELEDNLRRAKAEAENASRMKSEFLANMSHELRTPLNAVLGFTQLLADDKNLTDRQVERLRIISRSGEHLLALINDILDISKIEAGRMDLHPTIFDLHEFVGDLRDMFELRCAKKGLRLYHDTLEGLPRHVRGDLGKLRQVMVNLVGNAVKFTDEGGIGILVGVEGDRVRFSVRDTGRGIPEGEREAILQPFVQASTTDHEGGTGLGLAISSRYVAMMGGSLEVKSALGEGSEFSFSIPLERSDRGPERPGTGEAAIRVAPGREVTALVADDQEANRLVLKEMLERAGFSVLEAVDGAQALERARETRPDIVFMDIKMPRMDGYEAAAAIKADPGLASVRVFALTASAFSHDEARIAAAGFDGFLAKPFKLGSLHALIAEKGGVPLVSAETPRAERPAPAGLPPAGELRRAAAALGPEGLARLADAASINDFGGLARMAADMDGAFAAGLRAAADAYDEGAVGALLSALSEAAHTEGNGDER